MPPKQPLFLIANAHLDPVWLWEWEEGAAAALSTFRAAADICEENEGFVFNHNEAILYEWIEEYEPALFQRIQALVAEGRWHIMGGWYLQPDCNLPSGESFTRQMLRGRRYFAEKFGQRPTVAINFDPFGHTRGLVQIMAQSGFEGYLICRPQDRLESMLDNEIIWEGFDGSQVLVRRIPEMYNTMLGKAREQIESRLPSFTGKHGECVLWGVGNHGGGPSRKDLSDLNALAAESEIWDVRHARPEDYFAELNTRRASLPVQKTDINPVFVGCYTSQIRIKQAHRRLETELYTTEKMATNAALKGLVTYPADELADGERDLLLSEFHDILPGSSIQPVEEASLRMMGHGRETLSRARARCFFALSAGQPAAADGKYPFLVYNPHPWPIETEIECEFQLADQNWSGTFSSFRMFQEGADEVPCQVEKELSNIPLDWRKRVVFCARLEPMQMNRFDAHREDIPAKPAPQPTFEGTHLVHRTESMEARISLETGMLTELRQNGRHQLTAEGMALQIIRDSEDSWIGSSDRMGETLAKFSPLDPEEAARFAGLKKGRRLDPVRAIEDGPVRTVVETLLGAGDSRIALRYYLPKSGDLIRIDIRSIWTEKDCALKAAFPLPDELAEVTGQTAFGSESLPKNGQEFAFQKWLRGKDGQGHALALVNDGIYGGDCSDQSLRLTLQRSAAYSAHYLDERTITLQDRFTPRMDQGERQHTLWLLAGDSACAPELDARAESLNAPPMALSFFPSGAEAEKPKPLLRLSNRTISLSALKKAADGQGWILRLFNPTPETQTGELDWLSGSACWTVSLEPHKVATWRIRQCAEGWQHEAVNLIEEPV